MKIIKRIAIFLVVVFALVILAAALIPVFFKDQITQFAKEEINNSLNAKVDFKDVNLSLFRNFPNLRFALEDLTVKGLEAFDNVTLAQVESFDLVLDLNSVLSSTIPLKIKSIFVDQPAVNVVVLENGKANYDIAKASSSEPAAAPTDDSDIEGFLLQLDQYTIEDASVIYDDQQTNTYLKAANINHSGNGQFTLDVFDLNTKTQIKDLTIQYGGINYLIHSDANLDAIFNINQKQTKYTLKDNSLKVNDLLLNADGFIQLEDEKVIMDLTFNTPQNKFKNLLSLIPNAYIEGYESVKADGNFDLSGMVKGTYDGEKEQYPAFKVDANINNGNVKYPDLPLGISSINAQVGVNSPTSDFDDLVVNAPKFSLKIGNDPINGRFALKTPISDPNVDSKIKGRLNLGSLIQAFPVEGIEKMAGIISADIQTKTRMSFIEKGQYDRVDMSGQITAQDIVYDSEDYPTIKVQNAKATLTPQKVIIDNFASQLGKSDLNATGSITNLLAYFSPIKTMKGSFKVNSNVFDANEWVPVEETSSAIEGAESEVAYSTPDAEAYEVFDRFDFTLDGKIKDLLYSTYDMKNIEVSGHLLPNRLTVSKLNAQLKDSDFQATGQIDHIFDYLFKEGTLGGDINVQSNQIDLNQFMATTTYDTPAEGATDNTEEVPMEAILVPENINMNIKANVGTLKYGKINLKNLNGLLAVANRAVILDEVKAKGLGGDLMMSGSYDTPVDGQPSFSFKYDLQNLDFQETFNGVNTFQTLAPISKFVNGKFTSSLIMDSKLGPDLMPELNTLNAKGFLETINGIISGFKPLQVIGNTLDIQELKENASITGTKNWFEIKDGTVNIQEFDYQIEDIAMKIGGSHTLDQTINYTIKAKVPSAKLGKTVGEGFKLISSQASKLGLNVGQAEFVNLGITLTGNMQNPKVGVKLLGVDGSSSAQEAATEVVTDQVEEVKTKIEAEKDAVVDSVKTKVDEKVEEVKEQAKDLIKESLGSSLDSTNLLSIDSTKVGDIKKELDKWNPFKKKKKSN